MRPLGGTMAALLCFMCNLAIGALDWFRDRLPIALEYAK